MRVDEANTFLWRALVTGPEDTPYSGGCFIFDIYFPGTYPQVGCLTRDARIHGSLVTAC